MKIIKTTISDFLIIEPTIFSDERGFFFESYNKDMWQKVAGIGVDFIQDSHSRSIKNVLRGLHCQINKQQKQLVRVVVGKIFDVVVDLRKSSPTLGQWVSTYLSAENKRQIWVPANFAHGFLVVSDVAEVLYKTTNYYTPNHERSIMWNDLDIGINWPLKDAPILSPKDNSALSFKEYCKL